jgi:hypothetical protein
MRHSQTILQEAGVSWTHLDQTLFLPQFYSFVRHVVLDNQVELNEIEWFCAVLPVPQFYVVFNSYLSFIQCYPYHSFMQFYLYQFYAVFSSYQSFMQFYLYHSFM